MEEAVAEVEAPVEPEETVVEEMIAEEEPVDEHEVDHIESEPAEPVRGVRSRNASSTPQKTDTSIRVTVSLLDQLMNLAGELVPCAINCCKPSPPAMSAMLARWASVSTW